jgi:hypothetical protein
MVDDGVQAFRNLMPAFKHRAEVAALPPLGADWLLAAAEPNGGKLPRLSAAEQLPIESRFETGFVLS